MDSKKFLTGNPVLITFKGTDFQIYNASEFFYNLNIPRIFLSVGYIDIEVESPIVSANIDFLTSNPLNGFFMNLIIVDEDDEQTEDRSLRPTTYLKLLGQLGKPIKNIISY